MNTNNNSQDRGEQVSVRKANRILLGVDVHAHQYVVVRKVDELLPQPAQKFRPEQFLAWVAKQQAWAREVVVCYEAGPLGYGLARQLQGPGMRCLVIAPQDLDERRQRVKTDKKDARALVLRLDRYLGGNQEALAVVRVPSEAEEQRRSQGRLRQSLQQERRRLEAMGRGRLLYHGVRVRGCWWRSRTWERYAPEWPRWLVELLTPLRELILEVDRRLRDWTQRLRESAPAGLPVGLGELTHALTEREVCDWSRFQNRRQVGSYCGLCPREDSSGPRRQQGAISKHGNPRLRWYLMELAWRMVRFQPQYRAVRHWWPVLAGPGVSVSRRKKAIVAIARQLAVDLWRMATGRTTAAALGLVLKKAEAAAPVVG